MNTIAKNTNNNTSLIIKKSDINNNGEIFSHILLELIENTVIKPVSILEHTYDVTANRSSCVYKVDIIGKAVEGDELKIHTNLGKFDRNTAIFNIQIIKKGKRNKQVLICKASFSYKLENNLEINNIAS